MSTLITILGKARLAPDAGCRIATYRFPDGPEDTTAYFGLALAKYLKLKRLVLLGTAGSMRDVLIEHLDDGTRTRDLPRNPERLDQELQRPGSRSFTRGAAGPGPDRKLAVCATGPPGVA